MRISPYGLMALVILAIGTPTLVFAQTESETNEGANDIAEKQSSTTSESEHDGSTTVNSNLILFVTVIAIASVVGYSTWKVYRTKRRAASKNLV